MATTTNYSWTTPDDTSLVKDGAAAIRTLGTSIDTTTKNLNPSTTLGDIEYRSSTANTNTRLGIGSSGQVLTVAAGVPSWTSLPATAVNKNYLINGGFAVAQRGASFTSTGGANNDDAYTLDRWYILSDGNDAIDVTQDTTTVPTNGQFAIALDVETVNKKFGIATIIENKDVIGLVGNTVTFSFKAKVSATTKLDNVKAAIVAWSGTADTVTSDIVSAWGAEGTNPTLIANATYENTPANLNLTTSYATYSITAAVDTASTQNLILFIWSDVTDTTAGDFLYIAESKLELGSTATAFVYSGQTFQGEVAACQRYYEKSYEIQTAPGTVTLTSIYTSPGSNFNTTSFISGNVQYRVNKRVNPTLTFYDRAGNVGKCSRSVPGTGNTDNQNIESELSGSAGFTVYSDTGASASNIRFQWVSNGEL
jgi:hypothetical protein